MTNWQPIETLKQDGFILVTDGKVVRPVRSWVTSNQGFDDLTTWDYDGHKDLDFAPTHWMPLPDPPE